MGPVLAQSLGAQIDGHAELKDGVDTTVMEMLALAEGLAPFATKEAFIYRREGTGAKNEIAVPLEKIIRERKWEDTAAVRAGRVYCIRDEYLNTPAPTLLCGLRALAAAIHPECFPQVEGLRWINK